MRGPPPRARSALIVAPHPDDEALGCGGLVAALAAQGTYLAVIFVTDGAASHPRSPAWPPARLAALRASEADASLSALGAGRAHRLRLDLPDAADWPAGRQLRARRRAARFAATAAPDLAVLPWRRDPHRDHRRAHRLIRESLRAARLAPLVLEYPVWLDEFGAPGDRPHPGEATPRRLAIGRWRRRKRAAVVAHRSRAGSSSPTTPRASCCRRR